jgi:ribose transport system substrate-binding protein
MIQKDRTRLCRAAVVALAGAATLVAATGISTASMPTKAAAKDCSVKGKTIQLVGPLKSNPTLQVMASGFVNEAKALGFKYQVLLANTADTQQVIALGRQALAQGSDGIVMPPYDPALLSFSKAAAAKGVPVVAAHSVVAGYLKNGILTNYHPDPAQYGVAAADAIGKKIGGKGTVAVTEGSFNTLENLAASSFTGEMKKKFPNVKVLKAQLEGFDPSAAISKAVSILQSDSSIVAAYSTTGGGPVTWSRAQSQANRKLAIIGMDYTRPNLDLVKAGKVFGVVGQPLVPEFSAAVKALQTIICGGKVAPDHSLPSPIITKAQLGPYYALLKKAGV